MANNRQRYPRRRYGEWAAGDATLRGILPDSSATLLAKIASLEARIAANRLYAANLEEILATRGLRVGDATHLDASRLATVAANVPLQAEVAVLREQLRVVNELLAGLGVGQNPAR